jgi:hypothetical protein
MAYWQRGDQVEARRWYDVAVRWRDKQKWLNDRPVESGELARFRAEAAELLGIKDSPGPTANEKPLKKP